jgi:protein-tyrosine phosphatase
VTWPRDRARDGGIDEIPLPIRTGRLWLCGKHHIGPDVERALSAVGASGVVCLNERHELDDRYPAYVRWLDESGPERVLWFPIADLHAPGLHAAIDLVGSIAGRLTLGERLVMHCGAGIGRAGTVGTAVLLSLGVQLDDALDTIARHRPMAGPEAGAQQALLLALAGSPRMVMVSERSDGPSASPAP